MYIGLNVKYPLFLSDFNETLIFSKKITKSDFTKIRPVGAELFQTDSHDEAHSRFSQFCERAWKLNGFANAPENLMDCVWLMTIKNILVIDTPPGMFYIKVCILVLWLPET